ncbi:hypothetical protein VNO77_42942 [Canavalia gladiata]|uniref:SRP54-type proteins GTP-binding domain-containing protein n=1 Tax=Canavalia gladiata TaxID=3824 RepID=A0AAN9PPL1_CANGL
MMPIPDFDHNDFSFPLEVERGAVVPLEVAVLLHFLLAEFHLQLLSFYSVFDFCLKHDLGKSCMLVARDDFCPASMDQLAILGKQKRLNPKKIDVVIVDTAGSLQVILAQILAEKSLWIIEAMTSDPIKQGYDRDTNMIHTE